MQWFLCFSIWLRFNDHHDVDEISYHYCEDVENCWYVQDLIVKACKRSKADYKFSSHWGIVVYVYWFLKRRQKIIFIYQYHVIHCTSMSWCINWCFSSWFSHHFMDFRWHGWSNLTESIFFLPLLLCIEFLFHTDIDINIRVFIDVRPFIKCYMGLSMHDILLRILNSIDISCFVVN